MDDQKEVIYGVDLAKPVYPLMVRDGLTLCFTAAHCQDAEMAGDPAVQKSYCQQIVRRSFSETGGDFEKPTKESLQKSIGWLMEFSKSFRNPEIIMQHKESIMKLIGALE